MKTGGKKGKMFLNNVDSWQLPGGLSTGETLTFHGVIDPWIKEGSQWVKQAGEGHSNKGGKKL